MDTALTIDEQKRMLASPGIQAHSLYKFPLAIVSAFTQYTDDHTNRLNHVLLGTELKALGLDIGEVQGSYKGTQELAWLVELPDVNSELEVLRLAGDFNQETVMYIDEFRDAWLHFTNEPIQSQDLGKLVPISNLQAEKVDNWTRTKNGQYYTTTK